MSWEQSAECAAILKALKKVRDRPPPVQKHLVEAVEGLAIKHAKVRPLGGARNPPPPTPPPPPPARAVQLVLHPRRASDRCGGTVAVLQGCHIRAGALHAQGHGGVQGPRFVPHQCCVQCLKEEVPGQGEKPVPFCSRRPLGSLNSALEGS